MKQHCAIRSHNRSKVHFWQIRQRRPTKKHDHVMGWAKRFYPATTCTE